QTTERARRQHIVCLPGQIHAFRRSRQGRLDRLRRVAERFLTRVVRCCLPVHPWRARVPVTLTHVVAGTTICLLAACVLTLAGPSARAGSRTEAASGVGFGGLDRAAGPPRNDADQRRMVYSRAKLHEKGTPERLHKS